MSRIAQRRITAKHYLFISTVVAEFLTKALNTKTYNLADIPKGILAGTVRFFNEALEAVSFRGLLYGDVSSICTKIIFGNCKMIEEKLVYDLVRYRSFFKRPVNWNHQVLDTEIQPLQQLHSFFNTLVEMGNNEDPFSHSSDDDD